MFKTLNHLVCVATASVALGVTLTASTVKAASVTLFYNGNFDGVAGLNNGVNIRTNFASNDNAIVYQDFTVPTGVSWVVNSVFSNDQMSFTSTNPTATWEIRTGVSDGNGGTVVESGSGVAATQTATGLTGSNPEYRIEVTGLNFTLTSGTYWLGVAPTGGSSGQDMSFISTTSGAGAVGKPVTRTGNSFYNTTVSKINFEPASLARGDVNQTNFSMGITGSVTAVPFEFSPTWGLVILGVWGVIVKLKPNQQK